MNQIQKDRCWGVRLSLLVESFDRTARKWMTQWILMPDAPVKGMWILRGDSEFQIEDVSWDIDHEEYRAEMETMIVDEGADLKDVVSDLRVFGWKEAD